MGPEFSNTFYDDSGNENRQRQNSDNEAYRAQLDSLIERARAFPLLRTEGTSASNSETEHLGVGEYDGRSISLYFFIYTPEERPETHLPYSPSINAKYVIESASRQGEEVYDSAYLSAKHLDVLNSRYDEAKLQERFGKLERALEEYQAALAARGQTNPQ